MLPVIALVGRPNVGKSTLFNYLTRTRNALVADYPGLTRDRQYGVGRRGDHPYLVVDTGGITDRSGSIENLIGDQVDFAVQQSDLIVFLVDAREGLSALDQTIAVELRKQNKPTLLVVNKIDGLDREGACSDFHVLALGRPVGLSASHGIGVGSLLAQVHEILPEDDSVREEEANEGIAIAVVGRPNVGKSTLINRLLGEQRVVVFDQPGTTRDSIFIPFERDGKAYTLIDTAGIRKRARISEKIEKFSVIKAMQAIEKANVVIYLVDASEGLTDQDAKLLGMVLEAGRGLAIGLNKWDGLSHDQKQIVRRQIDLKLPFVEFAEKHPISALNGTGVGSLFDVISKIYESSRARFSASELTGFLQKASERHQPPLVRGRRIKLKYAHQGGVNPPVIIFHGNQCDALPDSYKRYLMNFFRDKMNLFGSAIRLEFKSADNPFKGHKNPLSAGQIRKRQRMMRFVKKRK